MSILSETSNANQYAGNPIAGGSAIGAVELDTKPVQNLAAFTYYFNKSEHEQRQKNADEKILELAELTAFDPNKALEKDKAEAIEAYNRITTFATDFSKQTPKNAKEKVTQEWEFKKRIASTQKLITSINGRAIAYNKRKDEIANNTVWTPAQKKIKLAELDKAADTDVNTSIASEDKFDETIPEIKAGTLQTIEASTILDNNNIQTKIGIFDPTQAIRESQAEGVGLKSVLEGDHKEFFSAGKNPYKIFHDSADAYNNALASGRYNLPEGGGIDFKALQSQNPLMHDVSTAIDSYNAWATDMHNQALTGTFKDKLGRNYTPLIPIPADHFFTIDKNKPLTGDQIILLEKFRKTPKLLTTEEQLNYTGDKTRREGQQLDFKAAWQRAMNEKETKAAPLVIQPAYLFGEHVNKIQNKFNAPGNKGKNTVITVSYKATDAITRKAFGIEGAEDGANNFVTYFRDGTAMIGTDSKGNGGTPLSMEQQKNSFINAVKGGEKDSALDAKFLADAETGIESTFGTKDGQAIFNGWNGVKATTPPPTQSTSTKSSSSSGGTDIPAGAVIVYKKGTNIPLGYELKGKKYKFQ